MQGFDCFTAAVAVYYQPRQLRVYRRFRAMIAAATHYTLSLRQRRHYDYQYFAARRFYERGFLSVRRPLRAAYVAKRGHAAAPCDARVAV